MCYLMLQKTSIGFSSIVVSFLWEGLCLLKGASGIFQQDINLILGAKKPSIPVIFLQRYWKIAVW